MDRLCQCPACRGMFHLDESGIGSTVECPFCHQQVTAQPAPEIPGAAPVTPQPIPGAPTAAPVAPQPVPAQQVQVQINGALGAAPAPQNNGTASIVLGILGLLCFPPLAVIGLIIGIVKKSTAGIVLNSIVVGLQAVSLIIVLAVMMPAMNQARNRAISTNCASNMKQLGTAMMMWEGDHNGRFPEKNGRDGLAQLTKEHYISGDVMRCPKNQAEYLYIGGVKPKMWGGIESRIPVLLERPGAHNDHVNVLFADGHVESYRCPKTITTAKEYLDFILSQSSGDPLPGTLRRFLLKQLEAQW